MFGTEPPAHWLPETGRCRQVMDGSFYPQKMASPLITLITPIIILVVLVLVLLVIPIIHTILVVLIIVIFFILVFIIFTSSLELAPPRLQHLHEDPERLRPRLCCRALPQGHRAETGTGQSPLHAAAPPFVLALPSQVRSNHPHSVTLAV